MARPVPFLGNRAVGDQNSLATDLDLATIVHVDHFHFDLVTHGDHIIDLADVTHVQFGHVAETFHTGQDLNEGTKVTNAAHRAGEFITNLGVLGRALDLVTTGFHLDRIHTEDLHIAIVVKDCDLDFVVSLQGFDVLATRADQETDLLCGNLDMLAAGSKFTHIAAGGVDGLQHLLQNMHAAFLGLLKRTLQEIAGHALDLDVHLQGSDANA